MFQDFTYPFLFFLIFQVILSKLPVGNLGFAPKIMSVMCFSTGAYMSHSRKGSGLVSVFGASTSYC